MKSIAILKKNIIESQDISKAVNYFFDLIEQDRATNFLIQKRVDNIHHHPDLALAIRAATMSAKHILKKEFEVIGQMFIEVAQEKFYHGYCILSEISTPLLVLYCSDYELGIASILEFPENLNYFRFSLTHIKDSCSLH